MASEIKHWILAARPRTLPAAAAPVIAASAWAAHAESFLWLPALLCLLFAFAVQILANFANDYYDFIKGADTAERMGPARAVASGWIAPESMKRALYLNAAVAFGLGLGLLAFGEWWFLLVGVLCLLCAVAYTGGPFPLAYLGLGDLFVMLFFGWVATALTFYVQVGGFRVPLNGDDALLEQSMIWMTGTAVGGLAVLLLAINNYRDAETDRAADKRTLVVRFGKGFVLLECRFFLLIAMLFPVGLAYWLHSWLPLLLLSLAFPAARIAWGLPLARTREDFGSQLAIAGGLLARYGAFLAIVILLHSAF